MWFKRPWKSQSAWITRCLLTQFVTACLRSKRRGSDQSGRRSCMIARLSLITIITGLNRMKTSTTIHKMTANTMLSRKRVVLSKLLNINNSNTGSKKTTSNQTRNKTKHTTTTSSSHKPKVILFTSSKLVKRKGKRSLSKWSQSRRSSMLFSKKINPSKHSSPETPKTLSETKSESIFCRSLSEVI